MSTASRSMFELTVLAQTRVIQYERVSPSSTSIPRSQRGGAWKIARETSMLTLWVLPLLDSDGAAVCEACSEEFVRCSSVRPFCASQPRGGSPQEPSTSSAFYECIIIGHILGISCFLKFLSSWLSIESSHTWHCLSITPVEKQKQHFPGRL